MHDYSACSHAPVEGHECTGGHVAIITKDAFNASDFRAEAIRMAGEWADMFESYAAFENANPRGLHWAAFEALTADTGGARGQQALADMLAFLQLPGPLPWAAPQAAQGEAEGAGAGAQEQQPPALEAWPAQRLRCAFAAARHPSIYRPKGADAVDAAHAYGSDRQLVCDIWQRVGSHARARGYAPFGGADCNGAHSEL